MTWDEFCSKCKQTVGTAADKINQTADIATLQVKLSVAEHKLNEAYTDLGRVAYHYFTNDDNTADTVSAAMDGVKAAKKEVDDLKAQIESRKQG